MDDRIRMTTICSIEAGGREMFARRVDEACDLPHPDPGVLCLECFMNEAGATCTGPEECRDGADLIRTHKEPAGALTDALKVARRRTFDRVREICRTTNRLWSEIPLERALS